MVVLLRLSPVVPFNLQNYAFGMTGISFLQYFNATLVGIVPGIALYVYFGIFGKGLSDSPDALTDETKRERRSSGSAPVGGSSAASGGGDDGISAAVVMRAPGGAGSVRSAR